MRVLLPVLALLLASCRTTSYYIVRHGEKAAASGAQMSSDVPLSAAGEERAQALKERLQNARVDHVFSTNTQRTRNTAQPLATARGLSIQTYDARDTGFVSRIKFISRGNVLIVGHSNTVDDLVNRFLGQSELADLPDTAFGDLFIITRKGKKYRFRREHFGK